jgi:hypothetical protein
MNAFVSILGISLTHLQWQLHGLVDRLAENWRRALS